MKTFTLTADEICELAAEYHRTHHEWAMTGVGKVKGARLNARMEAMVRRVEQAGQTPMFIAAVDFLFADEAGR